MAFTDDPEHPELTRGVDAAPTPQAKVYLVLSAEERAKGFVRPLRDRYVHAGRKICGKHSETEPMRVGGHTVCVDEPGHAGACERWGLEASIDGLRGCGTETRMALPLAETYASNPFFYGATYCVGCRRHLPVNEFQWVPDGSVVGS